MTKSGTDSTPPGDFKAVFRRTLLLKSSIGLFTVSILLVLACLLPLIQRLKSEQERHLDFEVQSRSFTVEIFLEKAIETAKQVTSRTQIREMLEKYNQGEISLTKLVDFTRPKLDDAINLSGNGVGVSRFDAHNNLTVATGIPIPPRYWIFPTGRKNFLIKGLERINGKLYLIVSAPIMSVDHQRVGTDIVLFTTQKIQEITQDTSGFGKTGEMILGRLVQNRGQSFYPERETSHPNGESELLRQKELDQAFAAVASAKDSALPCILREGHALTVGDRIKDTDWIILCSIDKGELYAPITSLVLFLGPFISVLLILGLFGMKRLLGPLADKAIVHTEQLQQEILEKQEALKQREQAIAAVRASEERYSLLVNSIPEAFWMFSADYRQVLFISPAYEQIWGRSCDSLLAHPADWLTAVVEEDQPGVFGVIDGIGKNTAEQIDFPNFRIRQPDGPLRWIKAKAVPIRDETGRIWRVAGLWEDITERTLAEEEKIKLESQLRQFQKMEAIGTLAGGIAHDFNNILSIIFGFNGLAMMENDAEKRNRYLEELQRGAERAKELVMQILAFSRKAEQQKYPLQVSPIIKEALKMLRASIPATIAIKQNIVSTGMVLADPIQIHQVIMNLCTNAYQAMRETGGTLAVALKEVEIGPEEYGYANLTPGSYLKIEVSDTGCGVDPEIQEKIFEPYFTTKKPGEGTGLGLAVVHGIVKSHNGHITLYSEPGKGTSFHVYLPLTEEKGAELPVKETIADLTGKGERILFVDDEAQICAFAEQIFSKHGYQMTTFVNGVQALAEFQSHPGQFDLVITDMTMPQMTGAELAQKIFAIRPDIPIILCTGQSELINREKALALGVCAYLNKPVLQHDFLSAVRKALAQGNPPHPAG
jgi:PAS domain S-box-containing protein